MDAEKNPPAFARAPVIKDGGVYHDTVMSAEQTGMTLADWFAGQAILSGVAGRRANYGAAGTAREAYKIAMACIAERERLGIK